MTRKAVVAVIAWGMLWFGVGAAFATPDRPAPAPQPTPKIIYVTPAPQPTPTPEVRISYRTPPECLVVIVDMRDRYLRALGVLKALATGQYDDPAIDAFLATDTPDSVERLADMTDRCLQTE